MIDLPNMPNWEAFDKMMTERGFTIWCGGEQPVPTDTRVNVIYRDAVGVHNIPAGETNRDGRSAVRWGRYDTERYDDIVAYMVTPETEPETGVKHDSGKPRFSLLPLKQIETVVAVLEYGSRKYAPGNWQKVENPRDRYFDAAMRHVFAWRNGEKLDQETHLAHAVCCLLFLMWGDDQK